nr:hypothetical protein [Aliiruegeria sabulilitoris]
MVFFDLHTGEVLFDTRAEGLRDTVSLPERKRQVLAFRSMVMKQGRVGEAGLTDQVLDDPQHGYTHIRVSSVLQV